MPIPTNYFAILQHLLQLNRTQLHCFKQENYRALQFHLTIDRKHSFKIPSSVDNWCVKSFRLSFEESWKLSLFQIKVESRVLARDSRHFPTEATIASLCSPTPYNARFLKPVRPGSLSFSSSTTGEHDFFVFWSSNTATQLACQSEDHLLRHCTFKGLRCNRKRGILKPAKSHFTVKSSTTRSIKGHML